MKQLSIIILLLFGLNSYGQEDDKGVFSSAGQTLQSFPYTHAMNFTFGSPFGRLENAAPCVEVMSGIPHLSAAYQLGEESALSIDAIVECLVEYMDPIGIEGTAELDDAVALLYDYTNKRFVVHGLAEHTEASLFIMDLNGKVVSRTAVSDSQNIPVQLEMLPQSMFVAVLIADKQLIQTRKFILNQ